MWALTYSTSWASTMSISSIRSGVCFHATGETGALMACLLQLELEGLVEQLPGGYQLTGSGSKALLALAE